MADVFISYKSEDRAAAKLFAEALTAEGVSVWWDPVLRTGETYDEVIERNLREAVIVAVLWSPRSVKSKWVRAEATIGERKGGLMPVLIETCERPIAFELTQTADLAGWSGDRGDPRWLNFVGDIRNALMVHRAEMRAHTAQRPPDPLTIETELWNSIRDAGERSDFELYVRRYPHGRFVKQASERVAFLKPAADALPSTSTSALEYVATATRSKVSSSFALAWVLAALWGAFLTITPLSWLGMFGVESTLFLLAVGAGILVGRLWHVIIVAGVAAFISAFMSLASRGFIDFPIFALLFSLIGAGIGFFVKAGLIAAFQRLSRKSLKDARFSRSAAVLLTIPATAAFVYLATSLVAFDPSLPDADAVEGREPAPLLRDESQLRDLNNPPWGFPYRRLFKDCEECPDMVAEPGGYSGGSTIAAMAIGRFEVTRAQYSAFVVATNRQNNSDCVNADGALGLDWRDPGFAQTDDHPVVCVNISDAQDYVAWLSLRTGQRYRLPEESERGFHRMLLSTGPTVAVATFDGYLGIYDTPVGEFATQCFSRDADQPGGGDCWLGMESGGWFSAPVTSAYYEPDTRLPYVGFRVVREVD